MGLNYVFSFAFAVPCAIRCSDKFCHVCQLWMSSRVGHGQGPQPQPGPGPDPRNNFVGFVWLCLTLSCRLVDSFRSLDTQVLYTHVWHALLVWLYDFAFVIKKSKNVRSGQLGIRINEWSWGSVKLRHSPPVCSWRLVGLWFVQVPWVPSSTYLQILWMWLRDLRDHLLDSFMWN